MVSDFRISRETEPERGEHFLPQFKHEKRGFFLQNDGCLFIFSFIQTVNIKINTFESNLIEKYFGTIRWVGVIRIGKFAWKSDLHSLPPLTAATSGKWFNFPVLFHSRQPITTRHHKNVKGISFTFGGLMAASSSMPRPPSEDSTLQRQC